MQLDLPDLPEGVSVRVFDNDFPEASIEREGESFVCGIQEHIYTKYWEHKFSAYAFAAAMERAVRRLAHEGQPVERPERDDDDVHLFVSWKLRVPRTTPTSELVEAIKSSFEMVWQRADTILEDSDSVLVLGKDTGPALDRLKRIASRLEEQGYYAYIIKQQRDRVGEGVIQKVLRFALSSKFVVVENTDPSGHLYEMPHVAKAAECVTVVLQEEGKGATWMFEDAFKKHRHWHKVIYEPSELDQAVDDAAEWAERFVREFGEHQTAVLPWMKGEPGS